MDARLKRNKIVKNIMCTLDSVGGIVLTDLKIRLSTIFSSFPKATVDLEVESEILCLIERGMVNLSEKDFITPTDKALVRSTRILGKALNKKTVKTLRFDQKQRTKWIHEKAKSKIADLGHLIGRGWKMEHPIAGGHFILDLVWFSDFRARYGISYAFEIQNEGDLKHAILNLNTAKRLFPLCRLCLVINKVNELQKARELLNATLNSEIKVVSFHQVDMLYDKCSISKNQVNRSLTTEIARLFDLEIK